MEEQIGALLRRDQEQPGELFETVIFAAIGPLPAGSARIPGILAAVFLEQGRRQLENATADPRQG